MFHIHPLISELNESYESQIVAANVNDFMPLLCICLRG